MQPGAAADKRTLIRRLLRPNRLPPTPEQIQVFLNDQSSEAFRG